MAIGTMSISLPSFAFSLYLLLGYNPTAFREEPKNRPLTLPCIQKRMQGECQGSEVPHTELCLFLGKTGFPNRENSEIFSQIIPRSLLGKCITTIYGIQIPENRNIVGLIPRSAYISKIYENILRFLSVYTLVYLRTNRTFPVPSERTTN